MALTNLNYSSNDYLYVDSTRLQPYYQLQGQAIDADIFLVNLEGRTLLCSNTTDCNHVNYLLPTAVLSRLENNGYYRETGKLGGIYETSYSVSYTHLDVYKRQAFVALTRRCASAQLVSDGGGGTAKFSGYGSV